MDFSESLNHLLGVLLILLLVLLPHIALVNMVFSVVEFEVLVATLFEVVTGKLQVFELLHSNFGELLSEAFEALARAAGKSLLVEFGDAATTDANFTL